MTQPPYPQQPGNGSYAHGQYSAPQQHGYGMPYPVPGPAYQPQQLPLAQQPSYPPMGRVDPLTGEALSDKSKVVAGLLQLFFGMFGTGRFYMGDTKVGGIQLALTIFGFMTLILLIGFLVLGVVAIWTFVDAIVILIGQPRDEYGRRLS